MRHVLPLVLTVPLAALAADDAEKHLERLYGESKPFVSFFNEFKEAVSKGDKEQVANMVEYPLKVKVGKKDVRIASKAALVQKYDQVFTPNVVSAVKEQQLSNLMMNYRGVAIGSGEVWYSGVCPDRECENYSVKVIQINTQSPKLTSK